jgi:hypothetical protein
VTASSPTLRAAGFEGRIVPVNPRADVVQGLPASPSLLTVDGPVDLTVIAVAAPAVLRRSRYTLCDALLAGRDLLPVTIGNVGGGAGLVGLVYWFVHLRAPVDRSAQP